jgi:hypothetical protein
MNLYSVKELKELLVASLGNELGDYSRPDQLNTKAIWVADRPVPSHYKVVVAGFSEPLVNALEVVVRFAPTVERTPHNLSQTAVQQLHDLYLIFHDTRQPSMPAHIALIRDFDIREANHLPATDISPEQYRYQVRLNQFVVKQRR